MKRTILVALIVIGVIMVTSFYWMSLYKDKTEIDFPEYSAELPKIENESKSNVIILSDACSSNSECSWQITNCCSENAGGSWKCISSKQSKIECNELTLCPQVLSPKPTTECLCNNGRCR